jgi:hypothetical protein
MDGGLYNAGQLLAYAQGIVFYFLVSNSNTVY